MTNPDGPLGTAEAAVMAARAINLERIRARGLDKLWLYLFLEERADRFDERANIPYFADYEKISACIRKEMVVVLEQWRKERPEDWDKPPKQTIVRYCLCTTAHKDDHATVAVPLYKHSDGTYSIGPRL